MDCYLSDDPSYRIHTRELDGDLGETWTAVNATQSMVPVEPVVQSNIRTTSLEPGPAVKTSYPSLLTKPDAADD